MLYNLNKQVEILRLLGAQVQRTSQTVYSQSKKMALFSMYIWFSVVDCQDHVSGLTTKWSQS